MKPSSVVQSKIHDQLKIRDATELKKLYLRFQEWCSVQANWSTVCWKRSKENSLSLYKIEVNFTLNVLSCSLSIEPIYCLHWCISKHGFRNFFQVDRLMWKNSKYQSISSECRLLINNFPLLHVLLNAPALVAFLIQVQLM